MSEREIELHKAISQLEDCAVALKEAIGPYQTSFWAMVLWEKRFQVYCNFILLEGES